MQTLDDNNPKKATAATDLPPTTNCRAAESFIESTWPPHITHYYATTRSG
jgi:hypothetical protein